jgi:hypothetical protein
MNALASACFFPKSMTMQIYLLATKTKLPSSLVGARVARFFLVKRYQKRKKMYQMNSIYTKGIKISQMSVKYSKMAIK